MLFLIDVVVYSVIALLVYCLVTFGLFIGGVLVVYLCNFYGKRVWNLLVK